jgi:hypothetical protein
MQEQDPSTPFGVRLLDEATKTLLGYFVHTWYLHYLNVVWQNLMRWHKLGLIKDPTESTEFCKYTMLFDFNALDIEKISYINGIYFYILACHKGANFNLMNRYDGKQVLYLRGYDYEGSVYVGGGIASGFSSLDTERFNLKVNELLSPHFHVFKVISPKDVYWETITAQRYFYGDYDDMIHFATRSTRSLYLNALCWKKDITDLLDRMDHFVVYVSSMTESAMWELDQLDTDQRRGRVTVVFDERAIADKDSQLGLQDHMQQKYGEKLIWSKISSPPTQTVGELREKLKAKFFLVTPDEFEKDIERHRKRIAESSSPLPPGQRETYLEFRFHPALEENKLNEIREFSAATQARIDAHINQNSIDCLPLFLNDIQLRIFMTLLMGEHHDAGLALAAYAAVIKGALQYYTPPGEKVGDLSAERRDRELELLRDHFEMAQYIGLRLLAFGKSYEFNDFSQKATTEYTNVFEATKTAVARFFKEASDRQSQQFGKGRERKTT